MKNLFKKFCTYKQIKIMKIFCFITIAFITLSAGNACALTVDTFSGLSETGIYGSFEQLNNFYGTLSSGLDSETLASGGAYDSSINIKYAPKMVNAKITKLNNVLNSGPLSEILSGNAVNALPEKRSIPEPSTMLLMFMGISGSLIPLIRKKYNELRRPFDIAFALVALALSFPLLVIAAILIKLESPGPIFYKQVRVGLNRRARRIGNGISKESRSDNTFGKPFTIYKLRTMGGTAEANTGAVWAKKNDARITRIGKILRKTRLDEVPQFINVLKGEMSVIGPRPERPEFVRDLNKHIRYYYRRFQVQPGITGLAQVRFEYTSTIEGTRKKVKYDLLYAKKRCILMDTKIIFSTFATVLLAKGAR